MPRYEITSPDGKRWEVEAPDGATQDQVLAYAQQQWSAQPKAPKPEPMSRAEKIGMGMLDPISGGAQLLTRALPDGVVRAGNRLNNWLADKGLPLARLEGPDEASLSSLVTGEKASASAPLDRLVQKQEAEYQAKRTAAGETGFDGYRTLGNIISPANASIARLMPLGGTLGAKIGLGAAGGAASGALQPVIGEDFTKEKLQQLGMGAVGGALAPALTSGLGRLISPKASTDAGKQLLRQEGVRPTIGQTLGGWANKVEEKAQSLPLMGDAIAAARGRAVDQLNAAAINRATAPIGVKIDKIGQEGIKEAGDALSTAYDDVLGGLKNIKFDPQWQKDYGQLKQLAKALPDGVRGSFTSKTKSLIDQRISRAGGMTAETMKSLDSELGDMVRRYSRSSVASEQELGDAFAQAQALLRSQVARNSPDAAERLRAINTGWANLVRVEKAGAAAINNDGVFSPAQLNLAIKNADSSVRKRAAARGTALMQDLGGAGASLGNRVPNSGTADRLMLGGAGLGAYFVDPLIPTGLLAGAGLYSAPAQSLLRGLVTARPQAAQPVAGLLSQAAPVLAPAGGLLALEAFKQ